MKPQTSESEILYKQSLRTFDERGNNVKWKNDLARDMNEVLGRVQYALEKDCDESDVIFARSALALVERCRICSGIEVSK